MLYVVAELLKHSVFFFSFFFFFSIFFIFLEEAFIYLECYPSVKLGGEEAAEEIKLMAPPYLLTTATKPPLGRETT